MRSNPMNVPRVNVPRGQGAGNQAGDIPADDPLAFLMQPPTSPEQVMRETDRRRRQRLLRIIALGVMVAVVLLIPTCLIPSLDRVTLGALIMALGGTLLAYTLNQTGRVNAGGYALMAGLFLAVSWEIIAKAQAQPGIDLVDARLYDLFVLPIVVSTVVIGRRGPIVFGGAAIAFTVASFLLLKHTPELQQYWDGHYKDAVPGSVYDLIAVPCAIQMLTAVAAWLGADSVRRALLEAGRADELAAANGQVQAQARAAEAARYRAQQGIAHLQQVHAAVARGQWDARANITEGELMPVALSLNLLLDRLSRLVRETDDRERVNAAAHELAIALRRLRAGEPYNPPNYTGTPFDEVLVELARLRNAPPTPGSVTASPRSLTAQDLAGPTAGSESPAPWTAILNGPATGALQGAAPAQPRSVPHATPTAGSPQAWPDLGPVRGPGTGELLPEWLRPTAPALPEDAPSGAQPPSRPAAHHDELPTTQQPAASSYLPPWLQRIQSGGDAPHSPASRPPSSPSQPVAPQNLPPWLREIAEGASSQPDLRPEPSQPPSETPAEAPGDEPDLPPWLQDIQ